MVIPRLLALGCLATCLLFAGRWLFRASPASTQAEPPLNLVLVTIDTLRADRVGGTLTPALNQLASRGVRFTNIRTVAPLTLPAHVSIMTGVAPPEHGVRENGTTPFARDRPTLAGILRRRGYDTGAVVASYILNRRFGLDDGFAFYDDELQRDRRADEVVNRAVAWLEQRRSPYFLWVHLWDPHAPYDPPAGSGYDGEVQYVDSQLGRLLDAVERGRGSERTAVIITADHGESLGEHGEQTHGMLLYEAALRVPLLVVAPGLQSSVRHDAATLIDVPATALALLGIPSEGMKGVDLLDKLVPPRDLYAETEYPAVVGWSPLHALVDDRWKLITSSSPELYDLERDPSETQNLIDFETAKVRAMSVRLSEVRAQARAAADVPAPPDVRERLRALGYVTGAVDLEASSRGPNPAEKMAEWVVFEDAKTKVDQRRAAEAIADLRRLVAAHPDAQVFHATYARALQDSGQLAAAIDAYRRASARWSQDATLHNSLGLLEARAGHFREATRAFEQAVSQDEGNARYWINLANSWREIGNRKGADAAYRRALELDPASADAANGMGVLFAQREQYAEAVAWLERATKADPSYFEAWLNLGVTLHRAGNHERAVDAFNTVLRSDQADARDRSRAARYLEQLPARRQKSSSPEPRGAISPSPESEPAAQQVQHPPNDGYPCISARFAGEYDVCWIVACGLSA